MPEVDDELDDELEVDDELAAVLEQAASVSAQTPASPAIMRTLVRRSVRIMSASLHRLFVRELSRS